MQHILNNEHGNKDLHFLLIHFYINYMLKLYFEYIVLKYIKINFTCFISFFNVTTRKF